MHHDNIEALRQEASRIIQVETKILQQMIDLGIVAKPSDNKKDEADTQKEDKTFDSRVPKIIEVLEGEAHKLENLDMVLAIVGTMKAGKSTTINAIVGTEILPNRNAPMTAIPTLIRHTKGQILPKLVFDNYQPLNDLIKVLYQQIGKPEYQNAIKEVASDKDLYSLIQKIRSQTPINHKAVGEAEIFEFLKAVNDLVRISPMLDVAFPFSDYDEIHELPIIEIEFTHLKEMESSKGRLILLDTPGPNEDGQKHLRPMLQDQLKKASAVLAVMDYTQLKSEADAQIRAELEAVAKTAEGRIYALVNKFDQKDRNGMQEAEVKQFVEGLVDKQITADKIFPVSSKLGYLSNRARHALQLKQSLPTVADEVWVTDFIEMANLDEDECADIGEVQKAIDKFWKRSNFSNPLENVIKVAFDNAALLALESAAAKTYDTATDIANFVSLKETALSKTINEIKALVESIKQDIKNVAACEEAAKREIEASIITLNKGIKQVNDTLVANSKRQFDSYFEEGVIKQQELAEELEKQLKSQSLGSFFGSLIRQVALKEIGSKTSTKKSQPPTVNIPSNGIISFSDNKAQAEEFVMGLQRWINDEVEQTKLDIEQVLEKQLEEFGKTYSTKIIESSQKTLDGFKKNLNDAGFTDLKLELPSARLLKLNINIAGLAQESIQHQSQSRTRYRDSDSFGSGAKRFFGGVFGKSDWGRESYEVVEHEYKVDFNKIKQSTNQRLDAFFADIGSHIEGNIKKPIEESSSNFFDVFKSQVEGIRQDLIQSMVEKEQGQAKEDELLTKLKQVSKNLPHLKDDAEALKKSLEQQVKA